MIWYNNIDAVNVIRQGIAEGYRDTRKVGSGARSLRLVAPSDHSTR